MARWITLLTRPSTRGKCDSRSLADSRVAHRGDCLQTGACKPCLSVPCGSREFRQDRQRGRAVGHSSGAAIAQILRAFDGPAMGARARPKLQRLEKRPDHCVGGLGVDGWTQPATCAVDGGIGPGHGKKRPRDEYVLGRSHWGRRCCKRESGCTSTVRESSCDCGAGAAKPCQHVQSLLRASSTARIGSSAGSLARNRRRRRTGWLPAKREGLLVAGCDKRRGETRPARRFRSPAVKTSRHRVPKRPCCALQTGEADRRSASSARRHSAINVPVGGHGRICVEEVMEEDRGRASTILSRWSEAFPGIGPGPSRNRR